MARTWAQAEASMVVAAAASMVDTSLDEERGSMGTINGRPACQAIPRLIFVGPAQTIRSLA